jgi:hypothetical protein
MDWVDQERVESKNLNDFAAVMGVESTSQCGPPGINLDCGNAKNGLVRLVLTLVKLLHELLERQAIKQVDAGCLTDAEIERVGLTLMKQAREIDRLREAFHLDEQDLNLDLGPLGKLF